MKHKTIFWLSILFSIITAGVVLVHCGKDNSPSYPASANGMKF